MNNPSTIDYIGKDGCHNNRAILTQNLTVLADDLTELAEVARQANQPRLAVGIDCAALGVESLIPEEMEASHE